MTAIRITFLLVIMAGLTACNPRPAAPPPTPAASTASETRPKEAPPLDIGDIESSLRIVPTVGASSAGPNVKAEEMTDNQDHVLMVTANVAAPFPPQFWVTFKLQGIRSIGQTAVAVRVRILRDKQLIGSFATFFDSAWSSKPCEQNFDVLAGLAAMPPTLLVHAEAELVMLPPGSDTSKVDPNTVTGMPDTTGVVVGSPMRINFGQGVETP